MFRRTPLLCTTMFSNSPTSSSSYIRHDPSVPSSSDVLLVGPTIRNQSDGTGNTDKKTELEEHMLNDGHVIDSDDGTVSEWRFSIIHRKATASSGFEPKHFRRNIGITPTSMTVLGASCESLYAIPPKVYMELEQRITSICAVSPVYFYLCYYVMLGLTLNVLQVIPNYDKDEDPEVNAFIDNLLFWVIIGMTLCLYRVFWPLITLPLYKNKDNQLSSMVEELHQEYRDSYGVLIGYRPYTKDFCRLWITRIFNFSSGSPPCVWLKGMHHREDTYVEESMANKNGTDGVTTPAYSYPPMFVQNQFPGQVFVGEKFYHPSTGYDEKTWTLITQTHKKYVELPWYIRHLSALIVLIYILGWFTYDIVWFAYDTPMMVLSLGLFAVIIFHILYLLLLEQFWVLPAYKKVEEEVTKTLQEDFQQGPEDTNTAQGQNWVLKFVESALPYQSNTKSRRRYELVNLSSPSPGDQNEPAAVVPPAATVTNIEDVFGKSYDLS